MSGSRPNPAAGRRVADQHLGDRLSALVDGELGHDSRERVLAHLATCAKCKAEADAQRRLKNVFAEMAPPPPSESFLARLQGLPGGDDSDDDGSPLGGTAFGGRLPGGDRTSGVAGVFGIKGDPFGYVPARHHDVLSPSAGRGFRIHDVGRHEAERSASRGLRFAFAAAGAVSLAAVALGGVSTGVPADTLDVRGGAGTGSNVTPTRSQGTGGATTPDSQRRRSVGPLLAQGQRSPGDTPAVPTSVSAPLLPGVPTPAGPAPAIMHTLATPIVAGAAAMSPLIRPLTSIQPAELSSSWPADPSVATPGLLSAPLPTASPSSSPPTSRSLR
ncbi:zf-HC2 domain-containing protein [Streptomyces sp. NPDC058371]|uniref:anti-sigma factor family protein n=1 Tax=Streptomyces sp. NPDC058371 TaxID=3346463 RepID=UPI00364E56A4